MSDENYSKRELDEKFDGVHVQLDRIETQTTKTNGSVANLKSWRDMTVGALAILTLMIVPILGWALIQLVNIPQDINTAITQELQNYDVTVTNNK